MEMQEWLNWIVPIGTVLAALISARASKVSANAARRSNAAAFAALEENRKIAQNDWRIRLRDERMKVWHAFDRLMDDHKRWGYSVNEQIADAKAYFEFSHFLFEPEVVEYLSLLLSKIELHSQLTEWFREPLNISYLHIEENKAAYLENKAKKELLEGWILAQEKEGKAMLSRHMSIIT